LLINPNFAFYHIPKTGGQWVKEALQNAGVSFTERASDAGPMGLRGRHMVPTGKDDRIKFCFVRQPYDLIRSYYCYRQKTKHTDKQFPLDRWVDLPFEHYLERILERFPTGFCTMLFRWYTPEMDFVGQFEQLADDLVKALKLIREPFDEELLRSTLPINRAGSLPEFSEIGARPDLVARIEEVDKRVFTRYYAV
jgi:hypothetical protein